MRGCESLREETLDSSLKNYYSLEVAKLMYIGLTGIYSTYQHKAKIETL